MSGSRSASRPGSSGWCARLCRASQRAVQDDFFGRLRAFEFTADAPFAHHENAIAEPEDLGELGRNHDDGRAARDQLAYEPVDLDLASHVDPTGRLVEEKDL